MLYLYDRKADGTLRLLFSLKKGRFLPFTKSDFVKISSEIIFLGSDF